MGNQRTQEQSIICHALVLHLQRFIHKKYFIRHGRDQIKISSIKHHFPAHMVIVTFNIGYVISPKNVFVGPILVKWFIFPKVVEWRMLV